MAKKGSKGSGKGSAVTRETKLQRFNATQHFRRLVEKKRGEVTRRKQLPKHKRGSQSSKRDPNKCPLLQLAPELLSKILDECSQSDRTRMAQTALALRDICTDALFKTVNLPEYTEAASFREACRSNPNRKNQIQELVFPYSRLWRDWFRWDSAIAGMSTLRKIEVEQGRESMHYDLGAMVELASEATPNIKSFRAIYAYMSISFEGQLLALQRLELEHCILTTAEYQTLVRSLPMLRALSITIERQYGAIEETSLKTFTTCPHLNALRIVGPLNFSRVDHNGEPPIEFPSLEAIFLQDQQAVSNPSGDSDIFKRFSFPNLRQIDIATNLQSDIDAIAALVSAGGQPLLSAMNVSHQPARVVHVAPLFVPLRKSGFSFQKLEAGQDGSEVTWNRWSATRVDCKFKDFDSFGC